MKLELSFVSSPSEPYAAWFFLLGYYAVTTTDEVEVEKRKKSNVPVDWCFFCFE